ncbi:CaiB/BaiF CoA transferase family protein [Pseudofrankia inefficax]|uniref:L-carnitine dehydratase/bile acid-inducible protein F n=1 Tax=Pseudofrankia inefficax (strain DSM 45817 / CECT 9037 / DDB 130130 / EuI1c) TaxID=298654 RepID=E3J957_PSEI1|nr:CoA transferase [Pseudofrankia inefficax]ADP80936.1 L-carnitine dehydratase/bile acid-inducible protein F [Pseudofrankia inefficax]
MTAVMRGVLVLEVAEHTFVPAASALLADWGADVVKIEHVERGDAMRGLASSGIAVVPDDVHVLFEHSNRGKRSLGLDLTSEAGQEILYRLAAKADVFLTNKLPSVRAKLRIDVEDIRAHNPRIIYVRGTGQGERGPEADRGAYDALAFWSRAGVAAGVMRPEYGHVPVPPAPGFGDSIGAMTIAGGITSALFHRERTGEATTVDVSLLGTAMWSMGQALALSLQLDVPWTPPPLDKQGSNPLSRNYQTRDGRWLSFTCLQAGRYWPSACAAVGRPELATDPRFADHAALLAHSGEAIALLREVFARRPLAEWRELLADFTGQWSVVQDTLEAAVDPQTVANGYVQDCRTADGVPFRLAAAPVQFDGQPAPPRRAPAFNEHGDDVLGELGLDVEAIIDLKLRGVVA